MMSRKLWLVVLMIVCLAPMVTQAAPVVAVDVTDLVDGRYVMTIRGGAVTVQPLTLLKAGAKPGPVPDDPPGPLSDFSKAVRTAAIAAVGDPDRSTTAQQLAELYRQIGVKIRAGQIKGETLAAIAVRFGTDTLMSGKNARASKAWRPTRDVISAQWLAVAQEGGTDAAYAAVLDDAAAGLDASTPGDPQINIAMIMTIIKMILEILAMLK